MLPSHATCKSACSPCLCAAILWYDGRGPERHEDRPRDYDRRRGPSPVPPVRSMRDDSDRGYDRDRGYQRDREADRYDRARDRGRPGRERSPVLKKARYGRSRSPGRRSSRSPGRHGAARPRCAAYSFVMPVTVFPVIISLLPQLSSGQNLTCATIVSDTGCVCHMLRKYPTKAVYHTSLQCVLMHIGTNGSSLLPKAVAYAQHMVFLHGGCIACNVAAPIRLTGNGCGQALLRCPGPYCLRQSLSAWLNREWIEPRIERLSHWHVLQANSRRCCATVECIRHVVPVSLGFPA